jgi:hypothetical protein
MAGSAAPPCPFEGLPAAIPLGLAALHYFSAGFLGAF